MLQRRPNTFAQTNLLPHFSLATKRRTIHSGLQVTWDKTQDFLQAPQKNRSANYGFVTGTVENAALCEICFRKCSATTAG